MALANVARPLAHLALPEMPSGTSLLANQHLNVKADSNNVVMYLCRAAGYIVPDALLPDGTPPSPRRRAILA